MLPATITHFYNLPIEKPILSSIPPINWCPHNTTKYLCDICSKSDCSGLRTPRPSPATAIATTGQKTK